MNPTELTLTGPDGANPLGFLCALGVLRTLSNAWPEADVKMAWKQEGAAWRPVLHIKQVDWEGKSDDDQKEDMVSLIYEELKKLEADVALIEQFKPKDSQGAWKQWKDTTKVLPGDFADYAHRAQTQAFKGNRHWADFVAAIGCESTTRTIKDKGKDVDVIQDTDFRTLNGGGWQSFFPTLRGLVGEVKSPHIQEAIFGPWKYQDEGLGVRWDPIDIRQYAYQWSDPGPEGVKSVWGANLLAIQGLSMFPSMPVASRLETSGFHKVSPRTRDEKVFFTWPIWDSHIPHDVIRSLLALGELQKKKPELSSLSKYGIADVFRSERIVFDKYQRRNFTSAKPV